MAEVDDGLSFGGVIDVAKECILEVGREWERAVNRARKLQRLYGERTTRQIIQVINLIGPGKGPMPVLLADDPAKLIFIVHCREQIVAAFARRDNAADWARYRSENRGCRCTISAAWGAIAAFENGESVDV